MKELIDPGSVERILSFIAIGGPLMGLVIGTLLGAHEQCAGRRMIAGVLVGMIGTLVYAMWRIYGIITSVLGLDSVLNLGLQILLFAFVGAAIGIIMLKISIKLKNRI